ncbi:MAG: glycosyltransferase family 4 protein [Phycisphaerae bacterium]
MHILYVHQYFATRSGFTGTRSYEFSRELIARGHRVTMITSGRDNAPEMTCPPGRSSIETTVDGIRVVAVAAGYNNPLHGTGKGGLRRMVEFVSFAAHAAAVGRTLPRPDVIYATHTPLPVGLAGGELAAWHAAPFVFEVRDVWPDALVNIGALRNPAVIGWLSNMALRAYGMADHIVALSPGMKAGVVAAGVLESKVTVIPNGCDLSLFRPDRDGRAARARLGLDSGFVATYFGAMGRANGLNYVLDAAAELQRRGVRDITLVLHGDGGERTALRARAAEMNLRNVVFSDPVPDKSVVADLVAGSDACLTIYAATQKEQSWSPNKMFDALAGGRPVLVNVPGWLGETIESAQAGRYVDPARPAALADALVALANRPDRGAALGAAARRLAEREFARERLADRLERVLTDAVARHAGRERTAAIASESAHE